MIRINRNAKMVSGEWKEDDERRTHITEMKCCHKIFYDFHSFIVCLTELIFSNRFHSFSPPDIFYHFTTYNQFHIQFFFVFCFCCCLLLVEHFYLCPCLLAIRKQFLSRFIQYAECSYTHCRTFIINEILLPLH